MTARPKRTVHGPHTYEVLWVPGKINAEDDRWGEARIHAQQTLISLEQCPQQQGATLIHEELHHILAASAIDETAGWNQAIEEYVVRTIESPLLEWFIRKENRPAVAWLQSLV